MRLEEASERERRQAVPAGRETVAEEAEEEIGKETNGDTAGEGEGGCVKLGDGIIWRNEIWNVEWVGTEIGE